MPNPIALILLLHYRSPYRKKTLQKSHEVGHNLPVILHILQDRKPFLVGAIVHRSTDVSAEVHRCMHRNWEMEAQRSAVVLQC